MQPYCSAQDRLFYLENNRVYEKFYHGSPREVVSLSHRFDNASTITVNTDASLLAAASGTYIEVWLLGVHGDEARRLWKSGDMLSSPVVTMRWHPWARMRSGLIVLSSTHLTSVYIPLGQQPIIEKTELVDQSNLKVEPAGFGFGAEDAPLGPLSIYLGTTDGDIYRILPYSPPEIEVESEALERLRDHMPLDQWTIGKETWCDKRHTVSITLKRPVQSLMQSLRDFEPLRLSPFPAELYEETTLDLKVGTVGWAADLIVQSNDKSVNFYGSLGQSDTLVLVSSVRFATTQTRRAILEISPTWVFTATPMATHVFNISGWTSQGHDTHHELSSATTVQSIPSERIIRTPWEFVSLDSGQRWTTKHSKAPYEPMTIEDSTEDDGENIQRSQLLTNSLSALTSEADLIVKHMSETPFVSNWGSNLGSLAALNSHSQKAQNAIAALAKLIALLQLERRSQARDVLAQSKEMQGLSSAVSAAGSGLSHLKVKLEQATQRQADLRLRSGKVANNLAKLVESKPTHLPSQAEEMWFSDLNTTLPPKIESLGSQVQQLAQSLDALKKDDTRADTKQLSITPAHAVELQWRLRSQDAVITSLISKVK